MSLFHPETAEDKMAWVPIIGCFLPLVCVVLAAAYLIWRIVQMGWVFAAGPLSLYATAIGIAVWARLSLARKPGRGAASRKGKGNVEQSHIRSSRTGTGPVNR